MIQSWDKNDMVKRDRPAAVLCCSLNPAQVPLIKASKRETTTGENWTVIGQPVSADHSRPLANEILNSESL